MIRNYKDPQYKLWRTQIRKRDNSTCQWPHCNNKKRIHVHHIKKWADFPGLRYHINNGLCLCSLHHNLIKNNEENYESFFQSIILQKIKNQ